MERFLFFLLILVASSFFNPFGVFTPYSGMTNVLIILIILIIWIYVTLHGQKINMKVFPRKQYATLIIGTCISMFMPVLYHNQGLIASISATLCQLSMLSLFVAFAKMNITFNEGMKWIKALCLISIICYIISWIYYPRQVLGEERETIDLSRGIPRLYMPFIQFVVLMFLYKLERWLRFHEKGARPWVILTGIVIVLSVTRQVILFSFICGSLMTLHYLNLAKKILFICLVGGGILLFTQLPFVKTMLELTEEQASNNKDEDDIRVTDYIYFCDVAQANEVTRILGNGTPHASSDWCKAHQAITEEMRIYDVDVAWAAFYWRYGLISIIGLLSLFGRIGIYAYKRHEHCYTYWLLYIVLTSIASAPILYSNTLIAIIFVCSLLVTKYSKKNH